MVTKQRTRTVRRTFIPPTAITYERSVKASTCAVCSDPIPKKTMRVQFRSANTIGTKGEYWVKKRYFHPRCLVDKLKGFVDHQTPTAIPTCSDCKELIIGKRIHAGGGIRQLFLLICQECADSSRWEECGLCKVYYPRYITSPIIGRVHLRACDWCSNADDLYTIKERKRSRRQEKKGGESGNVAQRTAHPPLGGF